MKILMKRKSLSRRIAGLSLEVVVAACLVFTVIATLSGCGGPKGQLDKAVDPAEIAAANKVIDAMVAVYQNAKSYRDEGSIEWDVHSRNQGSRHDRYQYSLEFARPNRVRLSFEPYSGSPVDIVSDGFQVYAAPKYFFNQVVRFDAPEKLELPAFYESVQLKGMLRPTVACSLVNGPKQQFASLPLDLLVGKEPLKQLRAADLTPRLTKPQTIGDERCDGVRYSVAQDSITLWISQKTKLLRRVQIVPATRAAESQARERISISFGKAEINTPDNPSRFHWERGAEDVLVRELVSPSGGLDARNPMLGQEIPNYEFFLDDGTPADMHSLRGKTTVIDLWATFCPPCKMALPKLANVSRAYAGDDRVQFLAFNLDDQNEKTLKDVGQTLAEWGADLPFAQLTQVTADTVYQQLQVQGIPATIIISPSGAIQYAEVGFRPDMEESLPKLIDTLLTYEERLAAVTIEDASQSVPLPQVNIAAASQPERWNLNSLWSNSQLAGAGNLLVVEEADEPARIFVIDGPRSVAELDGDGKIVAKYKELVPEGTAISMLRTGKTNDGKRVFVAAGIGGSQVFVFDDAWQSKFAYPSEPGIGEVYDVTVGRFSGDGDLNVLVGYFGPAGVHALSLDGERRWRNRYVENVGDMAIVSGGKKRTGFVLCANQLGTLLPVSEAGDLLSAWRYRDRAVPYLAVAPASSAEKDASICAITVDVYGNRVAAGLGFGGNVMWSYVLPTGEYKNKIDPFAFGKLDDGELGYWALAAADGSVHWLREDGQNDDHFATGQMVTGVAVATIGEKRVLLLSSQQGVSAWALSPKPAAE